MMNRQIHWSSPDPFLEVLDIQEEPSSITFIVRSTHESCPCSHCKVPSTRPHSRYTRMIQDLPIADKSVSILLFTRKWFCDQPNCPKKFLQNGMIGFLKMDVELYEPKKYYVKSLFPPAASMVKK